MLGEYAAMKREAYGKDLRGASAYAVFMLPVWFLFGLISFINTLNMDPVPTVDALHGLASVLLPYTAFCALFLADAATVVINLLFLAYNAGWSMYAIVEAFFMQKEVANIFSLPFLQGALAAAGVIIAFVEIFFLGLYIACAAMFLRHMKYFTLKLPKYEE